MNTTQRNVTAKASPAPKARYIMIGGFLGAGKTTAAGKRRPSLTGPLLWAFAAAAASLAAGTGTLPAGTIGIPNGSFESPQTAFVDPRIDSWQKTPKPVWWDENAYGAWDQLIGAFANVAPEDPQHIDNCHGSQAIWLFANPQVGLFQDFDSTDWSNAVPSRAFDARFETGKSYQLTVGILVGAAYPMAEGVSLELGLYYREAASNRVTVTATSVTNTPNVFRNGTHLIDFQVNVPPVKASDAWAGQHIGVAIMSTVDFAMAGGYWDLDNVRLTETRAPILVGATATNGCFGFTLESEPGQQFEVLASTNISLPLSNWASLGILTNDTGSVFFGDPATNSVRRFYRARQLP
jgi:hypothetical protein